MSECWVNVWVGPVEDAPWMGDECWQSLPYRSLKDAVQGARPGFVCGRVVYRLHVRAKAA